MNKRHWSAASGLAVGALVVTGLTVPMQAQAASGGGAPTSSDPAAASRPDNLPNPLADAAAAERKDAVSKLVRGEASTKVINGNRVIEVKSKGKDAKGKAKKSKYIDYPVQREEDIFTVLVDFGDQINPNTLGHARSRPQPDRGTRPELGRQRHGRQLHLLGRRLQPGALPGPDVRQRRVLQGLLPQAAQRSLPGQGRCLRLGQGALQRGPLRLEQVRATPPTATGPSSRTPRNAWYDAQKAAGKSDAADQDLPRPVRQGRPLRLRRRRQLQRARRLHRPLPGDPRRRGRGGRWRRPGRRRDLVAPLVRLLERGRQHRPDGEPQPAAPRSATPGMWIGDYTTEPENGGLGVFSHEFGHDLGLPDLYDTAGGDNGTGFWTLMSGGSWLNHGTDSIGTTPGYMGAWEKLQLGWLDPQVVPFGQDTTVTLGSADKVRKNEAQAIIVPLPDRTVTKEHNTPHSGAAEWWSGLGDNLNATLARNIDLTGASSGSVSAYVQGGLEVDYDYLYGEVSTNGGTSWTQVGAADRRHLRLEPEDLGPVGLRRSERPVPLPRRDRRWRVERGLPRRHRGDRAVPRPRRTTSRPGPTAGPPVAASASSTARPRAWSRTCTWPRTASTAGTTPP